MTSDGNLILNMWNFKLVELKKLCRNNFKLTLNGLFILLTPISLRHKGKCGFQFTAHLQIQFKIVSKINYEGDN